MKIANENISGAFFPKWPTIGNMPFHRVDEGVSPECEIKCPITGTTPDIYLFSSTDTRFGEKEINHFFYSTQSCLAVTTPLVKKVDLDRLYRKNYSNPQPEVIFPAGNSDSSFKDYNKSKLLSRFINSRFLPGVKNISWDDQTCSELLLLIDSSFDRDSNDISFLDVGCFDGLLLQKIKEKTKWKLTGIEPNGVAVKSALEKGLNVYNGSAEDPLENISAETKFDIIFLGQTIEHLQTPLQTVKLLSNLLKPGGELIISTPNINSFQINLFGPTWSHWHPPYHRFLFSSFSLQLLGEKAGLICKRWRSYSHPFWSALSLQLNDIGIRGAVPHGIVPPESVMKRAERVVFLSKYLWDSKGGGDYFYLTLSKN